MPRNLDRRVEISFPIEDKRLIRYLRDELLAVYLTDNVKARRMRSDGSYERVRPDPGVAPLDSQQWFISHRTPAVAMPATEEAG